VTFSELKARVVADAWPLGAPENLTGLLDGYVLSGLIEIQRLIKCFRYRHDDVYDQCRTYWHSGATVIGAPRGDILRVYTVENVNDTATWSRPVPYRAVSFPEFRRWQAAWRSRWSSAMLKAPADSGLPLGFEAASDVSDASSGRALAGIYALEETTRRLYVGPWIQSNEKLVVEWQGIKRDWADGDLTPSDEDFIRLLRLWIEREYGRKWASSDLAIREMAWKEALADMAVTCERESRLRGDPVTSEEANAAEWSAFTPEPDVVTDTPATTEESVKVVIVGDTGHANANSILVANAIIDEEPDNVLLAGDNKYPPNAAAAALAPYASFTSEGTLRAALGNHDLDDGLLGGDVRALVQNPGNGRYFSYRVGPITFFVVNSGINTAGTRVEPDGNWEGSRQWSEIAGAILRDTNLWKVLVLHHPPYTSSTNYYPGTNVVRWVGNLPVHLVVSGHSHHYERLTVAGRTFIVAGTGGSDLYNFRSSPYPGSQTRIKSFGYLRLTADCSSLLAEFVDTDGVVRDSKEFNDTPQLPTTPIALDPYITVQPASQAVTYNSSVTLSVTAVGTAPMYYQWTRDGVELEGETEATLTIPSFTTAGTYRCLVYNSVGSTLSDGALVLVISGVGSQVDTLAEFRAGNFTGAEWIVLLHDINGDPGYYVPGGTGADDGKNEIIDSAGNHFTWTPL